MGKKTKFSFFSVWAPIALFAFLLSCGTVARTSPNVGVYKGEPLIYPHPCKKVRETCKEVLADQGYMVVAEDGNKIRSIRHAHFGS